MSHNGLVVAPVHVDNLRDYVARAGHLLDEVCGAAGTPRRDDAVHRHHVLLAELTGWWLWCGSMSGRRTGRATRQWRPTSFLTAPRASFPSASRRRPS